jgi:hypothetical protein
MGWPDALAKRSIPLPGSAVPPKVMASPTTAPALGLVMTGEAGRAGVLPGDGDGDGDGDGASEGNGAFVGDGVSVSAGACVGLGSSTGAENAGEAGPAMKASAARKDAAARSAELRGARRGRGIVSKASRMRETTRSDE